MLDTVSAARIASVMALSSAALLDSATVTTSATHWRTAVEISLRSTAQREVGRLYTGLHRERLYRYRFVWFDG